MIDWNHINHYISEAETILLTMHENPDGDGLGSATAMYHYLKEVDKDCRIIQVSKLPLEYHYLNAGDIIETYDLDRHGKWIANVDLVIIFDVGDFKRIRAIKDQIEQHNIATLNIDHHPHPEDHPFTHSVVDLKAASTGDMVYDYIKTVRNGNITKAMAEGIYTAVMTDTGCFRYSNTNSHCHNIAIECIEVGVDTTNLYQRIYESSSHARVPLTGQDTAGYPLRVGWSFAWFVINQKMMDEQRQQMLMWKDSVFLSTIRGVEVAMMVLENADGGCRLNFRSKGKYKI
ncbi:MAG: phosphoesterase [Candidatus Neomarinimicrobiota bacterium]|nr:MAG: phosphoesterase [Candidatus Neomarinimicrobiota bacterium]